MRGCLLKFTLHWPDGALRRCALVFAAAWLIAACSGCDGLGPEEGNLQEFVIDFSRQVLAALLL